MQEVRDYPELQYNRRYDSRTLLTLRVLHYITIQVEFTSQITTKDAIDERLLRTPEEIHKNVVQTIQPSLLFNVNFFSRKNECFQRI